MSTAEKPRGYRNKENQSCKPLRSSIGSTKVNRRTLNEIYLRQNRMMARIEKETSELIEEIDRLCQTKKR
jgi:hypothetical protein